MHVAIGGGRMLAIRSGSLSLPPRSPGTPELGADVQRPAALDRNRSTPVGGMPEPRPSGVSRAEAGVMHDALYGLVRDQSVVMTCSQPPEAGPFPCTSC